MYLLLKGEEKIIVDSVEEIGNYNINDYKVYSLGFVDTSELVDEKDIRDTISRILKGNEMTKNEVVDKASELLDIQKSKVSKVLSKMRKEKMVFSLDDYNYLGEKLITLCL